MRARNVIGVVVSAVAIAWLVRRYDFASAVEAATRADPRYVAPAFGLLTGGFLLRALRWRLLFADDPRPSLRNAFGAMMAGYLFNNVLPARAGELVRVYLLARAEACAKSRILGTVVLERVLELAVFAALALATVAVRPVPDWLRNAAITFLAIGTIAGAILVLAPQGISFVVRLLRPLLDRASARLASAVVRTLNAFSDGLRGLRRPGPLAGILSLTALIWAIEVGMLLLVAAAFRIGIGFLDSLFVLILIAAGTLIPAAPGFIGTFEVFGVLAFGFLGKPQETALACVIAIHALQLIGSCLLGGIGIMLLQQGAGAFRTADLLHETMSEDASTETNANTTELPAGNRR